MKKEVGVMIFGVSHKIKCFLLRLKQIQCAEGQNESCLVKRFAITIILIRKEEGSDPLLGFGLITTVMV